jgi:uncharacterized protein (DUF983 family)
MRCPNCGSGVTRRVEAGFVFDSRYCADCGSPRRSVSREFRIWVLALLLVLITGNPFIGALLLSREGGHRRRFVVVLHL